MSFSSEFSLKNPRADARTLTWNAFGQPNAVGHRRLFQIELGSGRDFGEESVKAHRLDHFGVDLHPLVGGLVDPESSLHPFENPPFVVARFVSGLGLGIQNPTGVPVHLRLAGEVKLERVHHFLQHLMIMFGLLLVLSDAALPLPFGFLLPSFDLPLQFPLLGRLFIWRKRLVVDRCNKVIRRAVDHRALGTFWPWA